MIYYDPDQGWIDDGQPDPWDPSTQGPQDTSGGSTTPSSGGSSTPDPASSGGSPDPYTNWGGPLSTQYSSQVASGERDPVDYGASNIIDRDSSAWEQMLKDYAASKGVQYDPSDLAGVQRNFSYAANIGRDPMEFIQNQFSIYDQRASNVPGQSSYINQNSPEGQFLMNQPGGPTGTGMDSNIFSVPGPTGQAGLNRDLFQQVGGRVMGGTDAGRMARPEGGTWSADDDSPYSSQIQKLIDQLYSNYQR